MIIPGQAHGLGDALVFDGRLQCCADIQWAEVAAMPQDTTIPGAAVGEIVE